MPFGQAQGGFALKVVPASKVGWLLLKFLSCLKTTKTYAFYD
jgi:hypothetical protein